MSRQAVVLIHGIGEQRPMATLREFVESTWVNDHSLHKEHADGARVWSKPFDLVSDFELRRLTTAENASGMRTDFFELYWAHLMRGTKVSHVLSWGKNLLVRWPWTVPRHLQLTYWTLLALSGFGMFVAARLAVVEARHEPLPRWLSWAVTVFVIPAVLGILTKVVGDAARYLDASPANVQSRHKIRAAGLAFLEALHEPARGYDRIIVVGHSLGSVIGYDILTHLWARHSRQPSPSATLRYESLEAIEGLARQLDDQASARKSGVRAGGAASGQPNIEAIQAAQRNYFNELKANGARWRITDFITLGSPLAHAEILIANSGGELRRRVNDRELPRCLPVLERSLHREPRRTFSFPAADVERTPHHAALFAATRWTNLYFPNRFILGGDLVGGPVRQLFGEAVNDQPVQSRRWFGLLNHTRYWKSDGADPNKNEHIAKLRMALDLLDQRAGDTSNAAAPRRSA